MKKIFKYELKVTDTQVLELPYEHRILTVQNQNGNLCLWAVVDPEDTDTANRTIRIFGTGNDASDLEYYFGGDMEYISTVQMNSLVWHIFIDL